MAYSVITKVHSCIDKRSTTYEHEDVVDNYSNLECTYPCRLMIDALWRINVIVHIVKFTSGAAFIWLAENLISSGSVCSQSSRSDSRDWTRFLIFLHLFELGLFLRGWNRRDARDILADI